MIVLIKRSPLEKRSFDQEGWLLRLARVGDGYVLPRTMYSGRVFHTWEAPRAMDGRVNPE